MTAVMAGALGTSSTQALANTDIYSFFASERARAATSAPAPADAVKPADGKSAQTGAAKAPRKRSVRKKPASIAPDTIAPPNLAENAGKAAHSSSARSSSARSSSPRSRQALGYQAASRERYRALIAQHAAANGIPFALGDAVVRVESRYQPHVSNAGALGLMQIKHRTARGVGYSGSAKGLMNPETNIKYGMKYLGQAYRLANGDTCGTVMRYQSGHYAKRPSRANLAYCAKVRTIIASLGTELAATAAPAGDGKTRVE
ncbi:lytic transglycosylase domain-containing protein [Pseudochelatococcus sp. B33]